MNSELYNEVKSKVKGFADYNFDSDFDADMIIPFVNDVGGEVIITPNPEFPAWENVAVYKTGEDSFCIKVRQTFIKHQLAFDILCGLGRAFSLGYKINEDAWKNIVQKYKMYCPGYTEFIFGCAVVMDSKEAEWRQKNKRKEENK